MYRFDNRIHFSDEHSSIGSAVILLLVVLVGFVAIGPLIGLIVSLPFIDGSIFELTTALSPPFADNSAKTPLFITQGVATTVGLIVIPLIFLKLYENKGFKIFFKRDIPVGYAAILVFLIGFTFMGFNAFFIEWNQGIQFPDFMRGFEQWAQQVEQSAMDITKFLTTFDSFPQFLLAFVVIAILPSIGEELVFRGMLQNFLAKSVNIHIAIWIAAIIFSSIHVQFYGFVPRMLLGALFGYLYYWSANLWVPIIAHFFNNGFTLLMVYLNQEEVMNFDIENTESTPWYVIIISGILSFLLMLYFYNFFKNYFQKHDPMEEHLQNQ